MNSLQCPPEVPLGLWQQVVLGTPFLVLGFNPSDGLPQMMVSETLHRAADLAAGRPVFLSNLVDDPGLRPATLGIALLPENGSGLDREIEATLGGPPHVLAIQLNDGRTRLCLEGFLSMEAVRVVFLDHSDPQIITTRIYPVSGEPAELIQAALVASG